MADISKISPDNGTTEYNIKDATARADISTLNGKIGAANGIASLNGSGKVPESQLPSYVNDVIEGYYYNGAFYSDSAHTTEITPETGKIYVDLTDNKTYRWSGSVYVCVGGEDPAWGGITGTLSNQTDLADALNDGKYHGERLFRDALGYEPQNFIPDEYDFTQSTVNGITFKAEKDGTITLSGTATADAEITIATDVPLGKSGYTLDYFLNLQETEKTTGSVDDSKITLYARKSGGGLSASIALNGVLKCSLASADAGNYSISLEVTSGTNLSSGVYNVYPAVLWDEPISRTLAKTSKSTDNIVNGNLSDDDYIAIYLQNTMSLGGNKITFSSLKTQLKTFFNTLYAKITDIASFVSESLLKDTVGWVGKNKLQIPSSVTTQEINGVTFTVTRNAYGEVTEIDANGTASTVTTFSLGHSVYSANNYSFNGCPSNGSSSSYRINVSKLEGSTETGLGYDYGNGYDFTLSENTDILSYIRIASGYTCNHVKFYPMLRDASITDSTYEPYHASVEETAYLVDDTNEAGIVDADYIPFYDTSASGKRKTLWSNIKAKLKAYFDGIYSTFSATDALLKDTVGWSGKNIFVTSGTTATVAGGVWTYNPDGTITVSGTPTAWSGVTAGYALVKNRKYILSGLKDTTNVEWGNATLYDALGNTIANIDPITEDVDLTSYSNVYRMTIGVKRKSNNVAMSGVIYPMLRDASIADPAYEPYHPSVEAEIEQVYADNGMLGAKNLLTFPYYSSTKTESGVTITVNSDGSITLSGTATNKIDFKLKNTFTLLYPVILSGCIGGSASTYKLQLWDGTANQGYNDYGDGVLVDAVGHIAIVQLTIYNSADFTTPVTIYPMLRLASDPDDTYQPYAMTNRELTEMMAVQTVSVTAGENVAVNGNSYVYSEANMVSGSVRLEISTTLAAGSVIATLSRKPKNTVYTIGIENNTGHVMPISVGADGKIYLFGGYIPTTGNHLIVPINFIAQ